MKRVNGFLDLDDYFKNLKEQKNLNNFEFLLQDYVLESDYKEHHYWLKINNEYYYFKPSGSIYEEIMASECAKFLGISSSEVDLAIFHNFEGIISKSYRKENCNYISLLDILQKYLINNKNTNILEQMGYVLDIEIEDLEDELFISKEINNLEIIWQALDEKYQNKEEISKIMHDLVLRFILNILILQNDAEPQNYEIEESENEINLMPFIDGELCFMHSEFFESYSSLAINFNDIDNNYDHLREFLKISSQEYIDLFLEKFDLLTLEQFNIIFKNIEKRIKVEIPTNIKKRIILSYKINRKKIDDILEEMKIRDKGVIIHGK